MGLGIPGEFRDESRRLRRRGRKGIYLTCLRITSFPGKLLHFFLKFPVIERKRERERERERERGRGRGRERGTNHTEEIEILIWGSLSSAKHGSRKMNRDARRADPRDLKKENPTVRRTRGRTKGGK
jgi:hypothetical protein